jgi:hypothetical protein
MPVELIARQLRIPQWLVREVILPDEAPATPEAEPADPSEADEPATEESEQEPEPQPEPAAKPQPQRQPARKRTSFNGYAGARRKTAPAVPAAKRQAEQEQIEQHLAEKGVTKCPPAYAAPIGNLDRSGEGFW